MKLLLDTHALVWWWTDDPRLPAAARAAIAAPDNIVHVSSASAWEIATKHRVGKWSEVEQLIAEFSSLLRRSRFYPLPIVMEHARRAGSLPGPHRDPFDRMLIAQAGLESLPVVTADPVFGTYRVPIIWDGA
jgi:PIN domain nuclease of toxin-antitoxin system